MTQCGLSTRGKLLWKCKFTLSGGRRRLGVMELTTNAAL